MAVVKSVVTSSLWCADTGEFGTGKVIILSPDGISVEEAEYMVELPDSERYSFLHFISHGGTIDSWEALIKGENK